MVDILCDVGSLPEFVGLTEVHHIVHLSPFPWLAAAGFFPEVGPSGYVPLIVH